MMLSYLRILRPSVVMLALVAVAVGALVSRMVLDYSNLFLLAVSLLVAGLVTGAGNVVNDYYDYAIDRINKPKRPIPSGMIKRKSAAIYAAILYALAITLTISFLNTNMAVLALFNILVTVAYSWKIKRTILGHFVDSWLASSAFLFGALISAINIPILLLFTMSYFGNLAREIAKGIEDMAGDRKQKARTLAVMGGRLFASWSAIFFVILAVTTSLVPFFSNVFGIGYLVLITVADAVYIFACFVLMVRPAKAQKMMKLAMFVALAAYIAGVL